MVYRKIQLYFFILSVVQMSCAKSLEGKGVPLAQEAEVDWVWIGDALSIDCRAPEHTYSTVLWLQL